MRLLKKYKNRNKIRSYTLAEIMLSMALVAVFLVISAPLFTVRYKMQGQDLSSIMCIKNELAGNPTKDLSLACYGTMGNPNNPCCKAINYCKYDQNNACSTLSSYADNGSSIAEKTSAKNVLTTVCDQGGREGCKYFVTKCNNDSSTCHDPSTNYDTQHYFSLPLSTTSAAKGPIIDIGKTLYNDGSSNIVNLANSLCGADIFQNCPASNYNLACYIRGKTCPPASSLQYSFFPSNKHAVGNAIVTDSDNNVYVAGAYRNGSTNNDWDILVLKMNSSGSITPPYGFAEIIDSSDNLQDWGTGIALDRSRNIYVSGYSNYSTTDDPYVFVMKMNSSGNITSPNGWAMRFPGFKDWSESWSTNHIAIDKNDNIYTTGRDNPSDSLVVLKMNTSGNWTSPNGFAKKINGALSGYETIGYNITTDSSGNVYTTGVNYDDVNGRSIVVIKMNSSGSISPPYGWGQIVTAASIELSPYGIATDSNSNVYISGTDEGLTSDDSDTTGFAIKMNSSGSMTPPYGWQYKLSNGNAGGSYFWGIAADSNGNAYFGGSLYGLGNYDVSTVITKIDPNGNMQPPYGWQHKFNSSFGREDEPRGIYVDSNGYIYFTGYTSDAGWNYFGLVIVKMYPYQTSANLITNISSPYSIGTSGFTGTSDITLSVQNGSTLFTTATPTLNIYNPGYSFQ